MLIGRMIGDEIEDQPKISAVCFLEKAIEILHRSENWIDAAIVSDVISEIGHGRSIDRRYPYSVDPESDQIIEPLDDAVQVPDAITVAILKRSRIDLVYHCGLPPSRIVHLMLLPGKISN
jgi:hypothetical protein